MKYHQPIGKKKIVSYQDVLICECGNQDVAGSTRIEPAGSLLMHSVRVECLECRRIRTYKGTDLKKLKCIADEPYWCL